MSEFVDGWWIAIQNNERRPSERRRAVGELRPLQLPWEDWFSLFLKLDRNKRPIGWERECMTLCIERLQGFLFQIDTLLYIYIRCRQNSRMRNWVLVQIEKKDPKTYDFWRMIHDYINQCYDVHGLPWAGGGREERLQEMEKEGIRIHLRQSDELADLARKKIEEHARRLDELYFVYHMTTHENVRRRCAEEFYRRAKARS